MAITLSRTRPHGAMTCGDTETLNCTATDSAGAVINLTGYTITYRLTDGTTTWVEKTTSDGISLTVAASGTFAVTLDPEDTEDLDAGTYWHACAVASAAEVVTTVFRGRMRLARITAAAGQAAAGGLTWSELTRTWDEL